MHQETTNPILVDWQTGALRGEGVVARAVKTVGEMEGVFLDRGAWSRLDPAQAAYSVQFWRPVPDGTEGGLFWGNSTVFPGLVGDEYFMTRGHFHARRNRAEYYATVTGSGVLVLMDEARRASTQQMGPGTTHYIPGYIAHRVVNTGQTPLVFLACWPSDAGYDYETIEKHGFSVRVLRRDGRAQVVVQS